MRKEHEVDYYAQIHVAKGLTKSKCCHFIVYVHSGMIIVKVDFDRGYFKSVIEKMKYVFEN